MRERIVGPFLMAVVLAALPAAAARADDKDSIVGRWDHPKTDVCYIRFNKDGTFRWVTLVGDVQGKYRFLPGGVIEFAAVLPRIGCTSSEFKYRLKDDTLEIKDVNTWVKYSRAK